MFLNLEYHPDDKTAVIDSDSIVLSYGQLRCEIRKAAEYIDGKTVLFCLCKNCAGSLIAYLSSVEANAVPLMLSSKIESDLLASLIETYTPAYIWCPEEERCNFENDVIYVQNGYCLIRTGNEAYPINDKLQLLMTTSGSTGSPKLVRYKNGNLEANAKNVAKAFGWTSDERAICDLGMQYTMGLNVINTHLWVGATVLLTSQNLMSAEFWDFIKENKGTNFTGVPFSYEILARLRFYRMDLPYLKTIAEGGGKLTDKRFEELAVYAIENGKRFIPTFGTTETAARMSILPPELASEKTGSIGRAIPEGELFLVDSNGNVITDAVAEGEMCYKGPNVTMGYGICKEDLLKGDEWNGVYHTGDLARRDEEGCYYITGRLSRFLKLLSYRVSLDQCERLIQEKFNIECACTGTDQRMDIYITNDALVSNVQDFICDKTGLFKSLFKIIVIKDIPRNESGKIRYKELDKYI